VSNLSIESGDKEIITLFHVANSLRWNFYENQMNRETLEISIENIEKLIVKLRGFQKLNNYHKL
jgi:hypothetical protein